MRERNYFYIYLIYLFYTGLAVFKVRAKWFFRELVEMLTPPKGAVLPPYREFYLSKDSRYIEECFSKAKNPYKPSQCFVFSENMKALGFLAKKGIRPFSKQIYDCNGRFHNLVIHPITGEMKWKRIYCGERYYFPNRTALWKNPKEFHKLLRDNNLLYPVRDVPEEQIYDSLDSSFRYPPSE